MSLASLFLLWQDTIMEELAGVLKKVWAEDTLDAGYILCTPYKATLKPYKTPVFFQKQYPLSKEKTDGIHQMIAKFLELDIICPVVSPYTIQHTHIVPITFIFLTYHH